MIKTFVLNKGLSINSLASLRMSSGALLSDGRLRVRVWYRLMDLLLCAWYNYIYISNKPLLVSSSEAAPASSDKTILSCEINRNNYLCLKGSRKYRGQKSRTDLTYVIRASVVRVPYLI